MFTNNIWIRNFTPRNHEGHENKTPPPLFSKKQYIQNRLVSGSVQIHTKYVEWRNRGTQWTAKDKEESDRGIF